MSGIALLGFYFSPLLCYLGNNYTEIFDEILKQEEDEIY